MFADRAPIGVTRDFLFFQSPLPFDSTRTTKRLRGGRFADFIHRPQKFRVGLGALGSCFAVRPHSVNHGCFERGT